MQWQSLAVISSCHQLSAELQSRRGKDTLTVSRTASSSNLLTPHRKHLTSLLSLPARPGRTRQRVVGHNVSHWPCSLCIVSAVLCNLGMSDIWAGNSADNIHYHSQPLCPWVRDVARLFLHVTQQTNLTTFLNFYSSLIHYHFFGLPLGNVQQ